MSAETKYCDVCHTDKHSWRSLTHASQQANDDRDCYVVSCIGNRKALERIDFA